MSTEDETYCRLCAEPTPNEQLIKCDDDVGISSKIEKKMLWINLDVSTTNYLPRTICFSCFDLLEKTWTFLHNVRTAQQKLTNIYAKRKGLSSQCQKKTSNNTNEIGKPINENWDDFQEFKAEVKIEPIPHSSNNLLTTIDPSILNCDLNVKCEAVTNYYDSLTDAFDTSGSDMPLVKLNKLKRKKSKKKKKKKIKTEDVIEADMIPNPNAETIPLDMSLYNMTWEDYTWKCANCDTQCKTIELLRLHSLEMHSSCCIFKCSDCGKILTNHKSFISHVRVHNKTLRYCCEYCNKHFTLSQYVKKHERTAHREAYLSCPNCGTIFDSEEQLQDHILTYAKGYKRPLHKKKKDLETELKCEHCNKEFKSISNLRAHKLVHTERSRDFSCHVCGKMFFTKGALSTHMSIHEDKKPFKCEFCHMTFRARGNLISHISLHSGAKPFVCEQCGKSFRVKRHLKSHSIVHTDLMPYVCQYCNKSFRFKTRLNLHLRQHTGSKPYTCEFCQRDFTNGSNYKKHMKRRHNIDTSRKKYPEIVPIVTEPIDLEIHSHRPI